MAREPLSSRGLARRHLLAGAAGGAAWALLGSGRARAGEVQALSTLLGPMVGHVTDTTAALWVHVPMGARLAALVRPEGAPPETARKTVLTQPPDQGGVGRGLVTGLAPDTAYAYHVFWEGTTDPAWAGRFRTAPRPGAHGRLRVATSSCMKPSQPTGSFDLLRREAPHLHLLLGDNAYHDSTRIPVIWAAHRAMRSLPDVQRLLAEVPTYAIWDDHDYAGNDADGTAAGKHRSLRAFGQLFANPSYGLPDVPGVFSRFAWGDVDVFLLDVRFHRSPDKQPDGPDKRVLGERQTTWLAEGLAASTASFKLIASGSALDAPEADTWRDFPTDRSRLFKILAERRVGGAVFLTGDLHRCLVQEHGPAQSGTYAVPEVISSGIANSPTRGFAVLDIDTLAADPVLRVRVRHGDGSTPVDRTFLRSALSPR